MDADQSEMYVCDVCGQTFDSEEALEDHVHDIGLVD